MNVLLISRCSKKALTETRRILDQFAERRGDRTWQTPITMEGLQTLRRLLRKSARKNTAVACHWIRGRGHPGWLVPIPVGFSALSELHEGGQMEAARDQTTPFRFVEGIYSIGEWVSPHRFRYFNDFLWYVDNDPDTGTYRLNNDYQLTVQHEEKEF